MLYKKSVTPLIIVIVLYIGSLSIEAQEGGGVDISFQLKTNHLWHGFIVTPGVMTAGSLYYLSESRKTKLGIWGGASFNGEYQEFSYFIEHRFSDRLFIEIVNHDNYSAIEEVDIFDYSTDPLKTGNFIDIGLGYHFDGSIPISLYYSVIVQGVDTYTDQDSGEEKQAYTNYVELTAQLWQRGEDELLNVFVGGAFSPLDAKNFYDEQANIVNVGFTYKNNLQILA